MTDAARPGHSAGPKFEGIELARFALAAIVVAYHYLAGHGPTWVVYGRFAVEAFFVISGFVVARAAARQDAGDFLIARVSRLWPALIVCSILTVAVTSLGDIPWLALLRALTFAPMLAWVHYAQVDPAYWSLVIEVRFYLGMAILLLMFRRLPNLDLISAIWLAASALSIVIPVIHHATLSPYSGYFIFGLLLCSDRSGGRWARWLMVPTFALCGWQAFTDFERTDLMAHAIRSPWWVGYCVAAVAIGIPAGAISLRLPAWLGRVSRTTLGPMSYPLYLIHSGAGVVVIAALTPRLGWKLAAWATAALALLVAYVISCWIEPGARRRLSGLLLAMRRASMPSGISTAPKA